MVLFMGIEFICMSGLGYYFYSSDDDINMPEEPIFTLDEEQDFINNTPICKNKIKY